MSAHSWPDLWKHFLDVLSHETIAMQIAVGLGGAFFAVMALEGIRASFFPNRIAERVALRSAIASPTDPIHAEMSVGVVDQPDMRAAASAWAAEPVAAQPAYAWPQTVAAAPAFTVKTAYSRRSSPRRLRIIGQQKPI